MTLTFYTPTICVVYLVFTILLQRLDVNSENVDLQLKVLKRKERASCRQK